MLTRHRWTLGAVLAAAVAVLLAGCGGGTASAPTPAPGITDRTVTIVSHQPLRGTSHPGYDQIAPAAQAYFRWLNARGGINGRTITLRYADDRGTASGARSALDGLLDSSGGAFAVFNGQGTTAHGAVVDQLTEGGVPDLFVGSGCGCFNRPGALPYTFGWEPDDTAEAKILARYVATRMPGLRVGVLYENDDLGRSGLQAVRQFIPAARIVDTEDYAVTAPSINSQIAALRAAGAQVVLSFGLPTFSATLALVAHDLGWHPKLVVAGADPTTLLDLIEKQSKGVAHPPGAALLDGMITASYLPSPDDAANPWIALFRKIHDADPDLAGEPFDANVVYGMAAASTFAQALAAAGPEPTRASLLAALTAAPLDPTGPGLTALTYSATDHGGFRGLQIGTVQGGRLTLGGPVYSTDAGTGPVRTVPAVHPVVPDGGIPGR
ncbi:MAG TPA: ABC transporter substrate-binding protein [Mycobacteriales bacterium]|nr:ABC transporter substrate-binding protein [Mycobacteriales bacterium]